MVNRGCDLMGVVILFTDIHQGQYIPATNGNKNIALYLVSAIYASHPLLSTQEDTSKCRWSVFASLPVPFVVTCRKSL